MTNLRNNDADAFRGTVDDLWAKSADPASDYVPLRAHLLDVAAVVGRGCRSPAVPTSGPMRVSWGLRGR